VAYEDEAASRLKLARQQADIFERIRRVQGPGRGTTRERFDALMVHESIATVDQVLEALVEFARPALNHSQLPQEMAAWIARVDEWHVVFYSSTPLAGSWIECEHMSERFAELSRYYHLEHNAKELQFDRLVEWNGASLLVCSRDGCDIGRPFFDGGKRIDRNDPWRYLEERTSVGLSRIRAAIEGGEPRWLICRGLIVLAEVEPNEVPIRQRVEEAPPPPPPKEPWEIFGDITRSAEDAWVARFEDRIFADARALADVGEPMVEYLVDALEAKGPKPRTSRIALAALGILGARPDVVVKWLAKGSSTMQQAAISSLATMGERARNPLVEGSKSKKVAVKKASAMLLRVLDDPRFGAVKKAREAADGGRLASDELLGINAQDLDWKRRVEERDRLIDGAGSALWYLGFRVQRGAPLPPGIVLSYEDAITLAANDALTPWAVALFLLEHPVANSMFAGAPSREGIVQLATKLFGKAFKNALAATKPR
jgi:hypothetical protein